MSGYRSVDELIMSNAHHIWRETYGSGGGETEAENAVTSAVRAMNHGERVDTSVSDAFRLQFAVQWIHGGCVTLTSTHKFVAALAASSIGDGDALTDIRLPATAFRVLVPDGILHSDEFNLDFTQINVFILESGYAALAIEGLGSVIRSHGHPDHLSRRSAILPYLQAPRPGRSAPIVEMLCDRDEKEDRHIVVSSAAIGLGEIEVRKRMAVLARRMVAGLLLTYSHTANWISRNDRYPTSVPGDRRGPPPHRTIFIGKPISLDVRPALQTYLGSAVRHAPPSVQILVRGHHKRQVVGVLRSGRKVIWIEPYWRGPEDAPILARPIRLGGQP